MALIAKTHNKKLEDVVREWDKNGDGEINRIEFRACVRNSLGLKADNPSASTRGPNPKGPYVRHARAYIPLL